MPIKFDTPAITAADIIAFQAQFGISDSWLAELLGYPREPQIVRHWKAGEKSGKPFIMVPSARRAFIYLRGLMLIHAEDAILTDEIMGHLRRAVPEMLTFQDNEPQGDLPGGSSRL